MGYREGSVTTTMRFPVVTFRTTRNVVCPACGRKRTIARTFEGTANPFNRNRDTGQPKTRAEVYADVKAEAAAFEPSERDKHHVKCWEAKQ